MSDHGACARWLPYAAMVLVATAAVVLAFYVRTMAGTALYDTNYATFHDVLSAEQAAGIFRTSEELITALIWLLILTNALWAVGTGIALLRRRKRIRQA